MKLFVVATLCLVVLAGCADGDRNVQDVATVEDALVLDDILVPEQKRALTDGEAADSRELKNGYYWYSGYYYPAWYSSGGYYNWYTPGSYSWYSAGYSWYDFYSGYDFYSWYDFYGGYDFYSWYDFYSGYDFYSWYDFYDWRVVASREVFSSRPVAWPQILCAWWVTFSLIFYS